MLTSAVKSKPAKIVSFSKWSILIQTSYFNSFLIFRKINKRSLTCIQVFWWIRKLKPEWRAKNNKMIFFVFNRFQSWPEKLYTYHDKRCLSSSQSLFFSREYWNVPTGYWKKYLTIPCQPSLPTLFLFYIKAREIRKGISELL